MLQIFVECLYSLANESTVQLKRYLESSSEKKVNATDDLFSFLADSMLLMLVCPFLWQKREGAYGVRLRSAFYDKDVNVFANIPETQT